MENLNKIRDIYTQCDDFPTVEVKQYKEFINDVLTYVYDNNVEDLCQDLGSYYEPEVWKELLILGRSRPPMATQRSIARDIKSKIRKKYLSCSKAI